MQAVCNVNVLEKNLWYFFFFGKAKPRRMPYIPAVRIQRTAPICSAAKEFPIKVMSSYIPNAIVLILMREYHSSTRQWGYYGACGTRGHFGGNHRSTLIARCGSTSKTHTRISIVHVRLENWRYDDRRAGPFVTQRYKTLERTPIYFFFHYSTKCWRGGDGFFFFLLIHYI